MMTGWHQLIADYTFEIRHRPGIKNTLPDHLSRFFDQFDCTAEDKKPTTLALKASSLFHSSNPDYAAPPEKERSSILEHHHLLGHFGANALVNAIHAAGYHWKNLKQEAAVLTSQCTECLRFNIAKRGYHPLQPISASNPFDHVAIDLAGPFPTSHIGNHYLCVLVDVHTRFCILRAIPDKSMGTIASTLVDIFCNFGFPKILQSDNGTEFVNQVVAHLTKSAKIDHRLTTPYHPRANGLAERFVQTATKTIKKLFHGVKRDWDTHVPFTQYAINIKIASIHKSTPFAIMFGRSHNSFSDFTSTPLANVSDLENLKEIIALREQAIHPSIFQVAQSTQAKNKARFDATHPIRDFPVGSFVRARDPVRASKLDAIYDGPYKIIKKTKGGTYVLQDMTGTLLDRNFAPHELNLISGDVQLDSQSYEVDKVLNHREAKQGYEYLVHWKGYTHDDDTWEPESSFDSLKPIQNYWDRRK